MQYSCDYYPTVSIGSYRLFLLCHEIIFYGPSPPSSDLRRFVVSYKRNYEHEVLVNRLVKLAQDKKCGKVN